MILLTSLFSDSHVGSWLKKLRQHDPALLRHSVRVAELADAYCKFSGMGYERSWVLVEGALLHDIGKLCVPASILAKPKQLSDTEKRIMALHSTIGAELLEAQDYYAKPVIDIVRRHHERLDGSGYPNGWRKKRTSQLIRVVAVCDAACAMTENRPYEDAWPWPEALQRLKSMSAQYDGEIVAVLEQVMQVHHFPADLHQIADDVTERSAKRASGVQKPKSAFFAPRYRHGLRLVQ